ncbi:MAG: division/cell wall cluster transcriptional repressor MraZ [Eggerthellaceae bacterium]
MSELLGEYSRKLDAKGRLSLPADFRKVLSDDLWVTQDPKDQCLLVFDSTEAFSQWADSLIEAQGGYSAGNGNMVAVRRVLNSRVQKYEIDNSGRINLDSKQRTVVGLDKDVVIVGDMDHFEIWDEQRWNQFVAETDIASLVS